MTMKYSDIEGTIVKQAVCQYGVHVYRTFICKNDMRPGTGDYEDLPDVSEDMKKESFCIWYEDFLNGNQINSGGGYFENLNEVISKVETDPCFKKWTKTTVNITLENIIQRKKRHFQNDSEKELLAVNSGYVRGFNQMLSDMNLTETEFMKKYLDIARSLKVQFENPEGNDDIDELSGYNNAIVDVLSLLDEKYLYDEST